MKKRVFRPAALVLALVLCLLLIPQRAEAASASLSGSSSVQAGSSVTLTLNVSGSNIAAVEAKLNYDSSVLEFTNYDQKISGWTMAVNGTSFLLYGVSNPINSGTAVLSVTLRVKSGAAAGSALSAGFSNITVSDGNDYELPDANWSGAVGAAPSSECTLSSLSCSNATLSPSFSANTTYYTTTVPYSVQSLNLSYKTKDSTASASVSGNSLVVGVNTVTVTCKAASGSAKTYSISVTRQQDPNYKASTDASLSALTMEGGTLSPVFAPGITDYVVYVPFETSAVKLTGIAKDEKALGVTEDSKSLTREGETVMSVTCTAEDGATKKVYTVHVYRMPKYEGVLPLVTATDLSTETDIPTYSLPMTVTLPLVGEMSTLTVGVVVALLLIIVLFLLGFLIGRAGRDNGGNDDDNGPGGPGGDDDTPAPSPRSERKHAYRLAYYDEAPSDAPTSSLSGDTVPLEAPVTVPVQEEDPLPAVPVEAPVTVPTQEEESLPAASADGETTAADGETTAADEALSAADEEAKTMSLDELLDDIHNL